MKKQDTAKESAKAVALVETAKQLFYRHGIKRVSVEEICRESGVSKMTFYRFFKNKSAIAILIIDDLVKSIIIKIDDLMAQDIPFDEKMTRINAFKIATAEEFGNEFFKDLMDDTSDAGRYLVKGRAEALGRIRDGYIAAQKRGEIRADMNIDFVLHMAEYLRAFMQDEALQKMLDENAGLKDEWETFYKLKNDPRITLIGRFLRRFSLDELPQLFNVLSSEMALVGPRPLPVYHQDELPEKSRIIRDQVRPGMTGQWQVSGRSDCGIEEMEQMDNFYVRNWSVWMDIYIVFRTLRVVFFSHGAY